MRGLFEGAKCAVYSRAQTKQGHGVIKEIRYELCMNYELCMLSGMLSKELIKF